MKITSVSVRCVSLCFYPPSGTFWSGSLATFPAELEHGRCDAVLLCFAHLGRFDSDRSCHVSYGRLNHCREMIADRLLPRVCFVPIALFRHDVGSFELSGGPPGSTGIEQH